MLLVHGRSLPCPSLGDVAQRFYLGRFCGQPCLLAVRGHHPPGVGGFEGVFSQISELKNGRASHNTIKLLKVVETFELLKETF